jgi:hypothetical protein
MAEKKAYVKPEVESQTIKLGVYGFYGREATTDPQPAPRNVNPVL